MVSRSSPKPKKKPLHKRAEFRGRAMERLSREVRRHRLLKTEVLFCGQRQILLRTRRKSVTRDPLHTAVACRMCESQAQLMTTAELFRSRPALPDGPVTSPIAPKCVRRLKVSITNVGARGSCMQRKLPLLQGTVFFCCLALDCPPPPFPTHEGQNRHLLMWEICLPCQVPVAVPKCSVDLCHENPPAAWQPTLACIPATFLM